MTVVIRQTLDVAAINRQLTGPNGSITRDLLRRGLRVQAQAKRLVQVDQGRVRNSIEVASEPRMVGDVQVTAVLVGTNVDYALILHNGSGVFGPTGAPITPVSGKFLVFKSKTTGKLVFAKSVQGQRGSHFLTKALAAARG